MMTLRNSGSATLQIAGVAISGVNAEDFSMTTTCGSSLAINTTCSVSVVFTPQAGGTRTATLTFTDNAGNVSGSQQRVTLTGTGLAPAATPTFNPTAGLYAAAQPVTISSATAGATIYYTTDGTVPTASSALYSAPVVISKKLP
ncbi:MAG TPA: chitobiase/beta-hexosaminidase C-terminal domain-containing protein [Terracidiphilus sp.]|jgi:hypothetical protein